jgi:hypothetical protein
MIGYKKIRFRVIITVVLTKNQFEKNFTRIYPYH